MVFEQQIIILGFLKDHKTLKAEVMILELKVKQN